MSLVTEVSRCEIELWSFLWLWESAKRLRSESRREIKRVLFTASVRRLEIADDEKSQGIEVLLCLKADELILVGLPASQVASVEANSFYAARGAIV